MSYDIDQSVVEDLNSNLSTKTAHLVAKRCFDIGVSAALLLLLSPVFLMVAAIIKFDSPGPVFFSQDRMGRGGAIFRMRKFRSMAASGVVIPVAVKSEPGDVVKYRGDPRVTAVGFWLRRYSIDELPQLLNVLAGTMSLVGPRPLPLAMTGPYPRFMRARNLVRPGITGLFQLRDRDKGHNARHMIASDIEYIALFSFWLDAKIILQTPTAVMSARGAF